MAQDTINTEAEQSPGLQSTSASTIVEVASGKNSEKDALQVDVPVEAVPTRACKIPILSRTNLQFVTLCWTSILAGWSDGSAGPLLPRIQEFYHIGYAMVSLVFVFTTVGFITGSVANMLLTERLGFGKIVAIGSAIQIIAYSIQAAGVPFPAFVFAYSIDGFGMALQAAQNVSYLVRFNDKPELRMGTCMAGYGVGALLSPLAATYFSHTPHWSYHFLASLGLAVLNHIFLTSVFRLGTQEECLAEIGITETEKGTSKQSHFQQIMMLKDVHILSAFMLCYVGAEVTLGGWIVTYIITLRHGGSSSGYISTGFWAGLTIGRVALLKVNEAIGERRAVLVYSLLATALEFVVWFAPSLIGDAIAVSLIGLFLGPIFPIVMGHAGRVLPQWLCAGAIGWIVSVGQAGSVLIPFITGAIAQKAGIVSLQPVLVAVFVIMTVLWAVVSRSKSKKPAA